MNYGQTGPRTENGKAIVAWNARTHGILSAVPVIPNLETAEEWDAGRACSAASSPSAIGGAPGRARRARVLARRVARHEREVIALSQDAAVTDCLRRDETPESLEQDLNQRETYHEVLLRLPELPDETPVESISAANILYDASEVVRAVDPLKLAIEGVPAGLSYLEEFKGWTAALVRRGLVAVAAAKG